MEEEVGEDGRSCGGRGRGIGEEEEPKEGERGTRTLNREGTLQ